MRNHLTGVEGEGLKQRSNSPVLKGLDLDTLLTRRPIWVLVDELVHTNVPGSRNPKRYQDVEELLAAGIHVMSTVNIQHIESLMNEIIMVDLTPEQLQERLHRP